MIVTVIVIVIVIVFVFGRRLPEVERGLKGRDFCQIWESGGRISISRRQGGRITDR